MGLDQFEGRSWHGLHRHAPMTMIAYAYLQSRRLAAASGGKKNRSGPAALDAPSHSTPHRTRAGASSTLPMPQLPTPNLTVRINLPK
jgi:SRSO17 transposase